jgi:hypothetical protein
VSDRITISSSPVALPDAGVCLYIDGFYLVSKTVSSVPMNLGGSLWPIVTVTRRDKPDNQGSTFPRRKPPFATDFTSCREPKVVGSTPAGRSIPRRKLMAGIAKSSVLF